MTQHWTESEKYMEKALNPLNELLKERCGVRIKKKFQANDMHQMWWPNGWSSDGEKLALVKEVIIIESLEFRYHKGYKT